MGERLLCKQEVIGSIPFTSTNLRRASGGGCPPKRASAKEDGALAARLRLAGHRRLGSGEEEVLPAGSCLLAFVIFDK